MAEYKFYGPKDPSSNNTERIDLGKGRVASVGDTIDLSDEEHESLSAFLKFRKSGGSDEGENQQESAANTSQNEATGAKVSSVSVGK
jgi:hypothetical protein